MCPLSPKLKNSADRIEYENNFTDNDVGFVASGFISLRTNQQRPIRKRHLHEANNWRPNHIQRPHWLRNWHRKPLRKTQDWPPDQSQGSTSGGACPIICVRSRS